MMPETEYDDERALTEYVLTHYAGLATDKERLVLKAIIGRIKADYSLSPVQSRMLRDQWGRTDDDEINAALADGSEAYRTALASRLLRDHSDEIVVNLCPEVGAPGRRSYRRSTLPERLFPASGVNRGRLDRGEPDRGEPTRG